MVIVIVGLPCTGKTTMAQTLLRSLPSAHVYHTDDYIGREVQLLDTLRHDRGDKIIEGIGAITLLKMGLYADRVHVCKASEYIRSMRHLRRGTQHNRGWDIQVQRMLDGIGFKNVNV